MTVTAQAPQHQIYSPILSYREDPAVTELYKGYKAFPKGTMRALLAYGNTALNFFMFCIVFVGVALGVVLPAIYFGLNALVAATILIAFSGVYLSILFHAPVRELLTSQDSKFAVNREHREQINQTRLLAKRLGDDVIPVLTEDHLKSIKNVYATLVLYRSDTGKETISYANDYERIAVLVLEDIKRESALLDLIENRGMLTMDDIEKALRDMEGSTTGPVQSGWL